MTNWATTADVLTYTGKTVTDGEILLAQGIVSMFADISPESSLNSDGVATGLVSPKNLRYLKMAVAYQTAWMQEHPDTFSNTDVKDVAEDGLSFTAGNNSANVLAPLARHAIRRLTWMRPNRSIRVGKQLRVDAQTYFGSRDSVLADEERYWEPT